MTFSKTGGIFSKRRGIFSKCEASKDVFSIWRFLGHFFKVEVQENFLKPDIF